MPSNRPSQYNRSSIVRNTTATQARQDEALRLRRQGMAFIDIARELGYTPNGVPRPQSAAEAVRAAERREAQNGVVIANNAVAHVAQQTAVAPSTTNYGRTFGVEIEFFGIRPTVAVDALRSAGIITNYENYNHHVRPDWKIVTDASVTSRGTGTGGLELVSPVLRGVDGLVAIETAVTALLNAGAKVDRTCGIHVHIGADGFVGADIVRVIDLYTKNNDHINTVLASSRHGNQYAQRYTNTSLASVRRMLGNLTRVTDLEANTRGVGRYYTVNVSSYAKYGTLEFRQHQGSLNGEKVSSWVKFLLTMMDKAVTMTDADVQDFGSLDGLLNAIGVETSVATYLNRRARTLTASR
jgi:hypothetical protein